METPGFPARYIGFMASVLGALAACSGSSVTTPPGGSDAGDAATPVDAPGMDATVDVPGAPADGRAATDTLVAVDAPPPSPVARHSSSLAVTPDGSHLYVANADADSVSVIDVTGRRLEREILLAAAPPVQDPTTHRYDTTVGPRAVALAPRTNLLYVTGQRSGDVSVLDLSNNHVVAHIPVGSEPVGVLVSPDERTVYVACSQDDTVVQVDATTRTVTATAHVARHPWALAFSVDTRNVYVTHLLGPGLPNVDGTGVTVLDAMGLAAVGTYTVPGVPHGTNPLAANGEVRGLYDLAVRPDTGDLWMPHVLLGTGTAQAPVPTPMPGSDRFLDFENTTFPAVSVLHPDGSFLARMTAVSRTLSTGMGDLGDIVSGPHAVAITPDGHYALVMNTHSDDLVAVDTTRHVGVRTLHPLGGHMPEGIVLSPDGTRAFIDARNSGTVLVVDVTQRNNTVYLDPDGDPIPRMTTDPMPATLRLGQRMFFAADSEDLATTQNHWVACASCHIEARSDAVTWRFAEGPRDTPSNAGGMLGMGFMLRTAIRHSVHDYWRAITQEQGSVAYDPTNAGHTAVMDTRMMAVEDFVNLAVPLPVPPRTDPARVSRGQVLFNRPDVACATCHSGPRFTDSGQGNPMLDLAGPVLLHDVGTCVTTGSYPDVAHTDDNGNARAACMFDTPGLRGVWDSAPYLHDGSAATLMDVLTRTRGHMGDITGLSDSDLLDLVEYLKSL